MGSQVSVLRHALTHLAPTDTSLISESDVGVGGCRADASALYAAKCRDLRELPAEVSLQVLRHLDATDLCLAACVWRHLCDDQMLWRRLCRLHWQYASVYNRRTGGATLCHRRLFMQLDEGQLTFNADAFMGMRYFISRGLVDDEPAEIALFLHNSTRMDRGQLRRYLTARLDVLSLLVDLHNYRDQFLAAALRRLFSKLQPPSDARASYLHTLLDQFSQKFCQCNPRLGLSHDVVYLLCFSLIMLSDDLASPHVKNKMSKREFIRNVRRATAIDDELSGHLYDDVYVRGHVAVHT